MKGGGGEEDSVRMRDRADLVDELEYLEQLRDELQRKKKREKKKRKKEKKEKEEKEEMEKKKKKEKVEEEGILEFSSFYRSLLSTEIAGSGVSWISEQICDQADSRGNSMSKSKPGPSSLRNEIAASWASSISDQTCDQADSRGNSISEQTCDQADSRGNSMRRSKLSQLSPLRYSSLGNEITTSGVSSISDQTCDQADSRGNSTRRIKPSPLRFYQKRTNKRLRILDRRIEELTTSLGITKVARSTRVIPGLTEMEMGNKSILDEEARIGVDTQLVTSMPVPVDAEPNDLIEFNGFFGTAYPDLWFPPEPKPDLDEKLKYWRSWLLDDVVGGSDKEKDAEMEGQTSTIDSKSKLEMGADAGSSGASIFRPPNSFFMQTRDYDHDVDGADGEEEVHRGKSDTQLTEEADVRAAEKLRFASYRSTWEGSSWGQPRSFFEDMTALSPLQFTHLTSGRIPSGVAAETTLQIFYFKLAEIKGGFKWPLSVYGVVAARDSVDRSRNLLFSCNRSRSQKINQDYPFLRLIGPSRAIVFTDPVDFEVQLKVKGKSGDLALISDTCQYTIGGGRPGVSTTIRFENCFCKMELSLERVERSVQATILGVRVVEDGSWPFEYGCRVACSTSSRTVVDTDSEITYITNPPSEQIVMLDSKDGAMTKGSDGYLHLSRQVVSVEPEGKLEVAIQAYTLSGDIAVEGHVCFVAKRCNISQGKCRLGDAEVEINVAWSLLVSDKKDIAGNGWEFENGERRQTLQYKSGQMSPW